MHKIVVNVIVRPLKLEADLIVRKPVIDSHATVKPCKTHAHALKHDFSYAMV